MSCVFYEIRFLQFLSAYTGLVELDLSDNQIESLDGIKVLSRLESLHLKCNKVCMAFLAVHRVYF